MKIIDELKYRIWRYNEERKAWNEYKKIVREHVATTSKKRDDEMRKKYEKRILCVRES